MYRHKKMFYPHITTERGISNQHHITYALNLLMWKNPDREPYAWLVTDWESATPEPKKKTLLAEIGRIRFADGDETAHQVARHLCETKPKTKDAVQSLRRWRLGTQARAGTWDGLCEEIEQAIDAYLARYPATDHEDILEALDHLSWLYTEMRDHPLTDDDAEGEPPRAARRPTAPQRGLRHSKEWWMSRGFGSMQRAILAAYASMQTGPPAWATCAVDDLWQIVAAQARPTGQWTMEEAVSGPLDGPPGAAAGSAADKGESTLCTRKRRHRRM
jgi:hypothetical protein